MNNSRQLGLPPTSTHNSSYWNNFEWEDRSKLKVKRHKPQKLYLFILTSSLMGIVFSSLAFTGFVFVGYQVYSVKYHSVLSLAQTGAKNLESALTLMKTLPKNPLDAQTLSQAQHEFSTASTAFVQLNTELNLLPEISTYIPVYGNRLSTALSLVPLAIEVSQAGVTSCDALGLIISRFHDPLNSKQGLTIEDIHVIEQDFQRLKGMINQAIGQINTLQPGDVQFDPRISKLVNTFHRDLPDIQAILADVQELLPVIPTLLGIGTPANYLIEVLDSTELRPAGGFIGNYGIATFVGGA